MDDTGLVNELMATNRQIKKRNDDLTCLLFIIGIPVLIVVGILVLSFIIGFIGGVSNGSTSKSDNCKIEAQERATSLLESKLKVLKEKKNKTQQDLQDIEYYRSLLDNKMVLKDDYEYAYNDCMR